MKKILLSLAATAAIVSAAAPAAAQDWRGGHDRYQSQRNDFAGRRLTTAYVDHLNWEVNEAARRGQISWGQARALRDQLSQVHDAAWRVETGQGGRWEAARVDRAVDRVEDALNDSRRNYRGYDENRRWADRDGWRR